MNSARAHVQRLAKLDLLRSMRKGYSVYVLLVDGQVEYVGQTSDPTERLRQHKYRRRGVDIQLRVRCIVETQDEAVRVEHGLMEILRRRGEDLSNCEYFNIGGQPGGYRGTNDVDPVQTPSLLPRSERLCKALTPQEEKEQRKKIRRMIEGSARMAEIEK